MIGCSANQRVKFAQQKNDNVNENMQEQIIDNTYSPRDEMQNGQGKETKCQTNGMVEVSVERVSKPITNDDGQVLASVYYERPVVSGNTEAVEKINLFFEKEEQDWFEGRSSRLTLYNEEYYSDFCEGVEQMCEWYEEEEILTNLMRYAVDTWIVLLNEDFLSVMQVANVRLERSHWHYFGATFDLETGDLVPIDSISNITPEKMKKIIEDTSEPVTKTYNELRDSNYVIHYCGAEIAMNYEYFYDGENYFIIINRGDERFVDGEILKWNGKWEDEYEMIFYRYWFNFANGEWIMTELGVNRGEAKEEVPPGEKDYCNISDFEDFHYFLFCNTNIGTTAPSVNPTVNAFIGDGAETAEAGVELYQKFMEPLWENDHEGYMELRELSPDAQLVITGEDVEGNASLKRWRFFDKGTEKEQQEIDINGNCPFRIIKDRDAYTVIDEETFGKKVDRLYDQTGYDCVKFNEQGNLAAGTKIQYKESNCTQKYEMAICDMDNTEILCTFYQGDEYGYVWQVLGDRESGKVVYVLNGRSFYEYSYPSGEIRYLGKDMYYPCYSPDGKYIAYSSPDGEAYYDLDAEEAEEVERILPGIYILEVETGKTAYIKQDIDDIEWAEMLNTRTFQWVEKDSFEKVMEERRAKQLYQEFAERLPLDSEEKNKEENITYVSSDCKCVMANKWSEHETMRTQILFCEKKK